MFDAGNGRSSEIVSAREPFRHLRITLTQPLGKLMLRDAFILQDGIQSFRYIAFRLDTYLPSISPTREGREAASSAVLPSLVGEGQGVGSVLLLFMPAFVLRKVCCKIIRRKNDHKNRPRDSLKEISAWDPKAPIA